MKTFSRKISTIVYNDLSFTVFLRNSVLRLFGGFELASDRTGTHAQGCLLRDLGHSAGSASVEDVRGRLGVRSAFISTARSLLCRGLVFSPDVRAAGSASFVGFNSRVKSRSFSISVEKPADNEPADNVVADNVVVKPADNEPADNVVADNVVVKPADNDNVVADNVVVKPADNEPADNVVVKPADNEPADNGPADNEPADNVVVKPADNEPADNGPADNVVVMPAKVFCIWAKPQEGKLKFNTDAAYEKTPDVNHATGGALRDSTGYSHLRFSYRLTDQEIAAVTHHSAVEFLAFKQACELVIKYGYKYGYNFNDIIFESDSTELVHSIKNIKDKAGIEAKNLKQAILHDILALLPHGFEFNEDNVTHTLRESNAFADNQASIGLSQIQGHMQVDLGPPSEPLDADKTLELYDEDIKGVGREREDKWKKLNQNQNQV
ncbi:hypothetical protein CASFOL_001307 [Castilleja foliolosa]|uniref:RNase H type-1 domain-containing protein n=1 Tax=Castilleja foliolosa TaxID=1961234 RepID=A0ABD3EMR2_9LAMI